MKRFLFSILVVSAFGANAQNNASLDAWTAGSGYDDPDFWNTLNQYSSIGVPVTVTKDNSAPYQGTADAVLTTSYCSVCPNVGAPDTLPGFIQQAFPWTDTTLSGVGFAYKLSSPGNDEAIAVVFATKWNTTTGSQDTVGVGSVKLSLTSSWTGASTDMTFINLCDSIQISFYSSYSSVTGDYSTSAAKIGTALSVDAVYLISNSTTGIDAKEKNNINIYARDNDILVNSEAIQNGKVYVYNAIGSLMFSNNLNADKYSISTSGYPTGIYLVTVETTYGKVTKRVFVK